MAIPILELRMNNERETMKGYTRRFWISILPLMAVIFFLGSPQLGQSQGTGRPVDMPVSLRIGQARTSEFKVKNGDYGIMILVKRKLPPNVIDCMLGIQFSSREPDCGKNSALQASWTLWSDGQIVNKGSTSDHDVENGGGWASDSVSRIIGGFRGKKGKKYILEVNFTKDGSAVDVTDPHLVVQLSNY